MDNRTLPIKEAAAGDQEAFAQLVHRMMPLIHTQVRMYRCEGVEDEDLVQEALMGLLAAVRTYRDDKGAAFTTYATTCIRNRLVSVVRHCGARLHHETMLEDDLPDPNADVSLQIQDREDLNHSLQWFKQCLSETEYHVLLLRLSDCSYAEIAAQLGITTKAVDNAIQRIRRKMV